jgi:hypothetical protein
LKDLTHSQPIHAEKDERVCSEENIKSMAKKNSLPKDISHPSIQNPGATIQDNERMTPLNPKLIQRSREKFQWRGGIHLLCLGACYLALLPISGFPPCIPASHSLKV